MLQAKIVLMRATWGCVLNCCSPRSHCDIKDNDEGPFFGAAGNNGDDEDYGTDVRIGVDLSGQQARKLKSRILAPAPKCSCAHVTGAQVCMCSGTPF